MRVHYASSYYLSLMRGARDHARAVAKHHTLVDTPRGADVTVFHSDIGNLENELNEIERLGRGNKLVGFLVWEADDLPQFVKPHLKRFDEIWTASEYCRRTFAKYHPRVFVIPHIVAPQPFTKQDVRFVDQLFPRAPEEVRFLFITTADPKRKNAAQLVDVFSHVRSEMPGARLIIKGYNIDGEVARSRFATVAIEFLSNAHISALIAGSDVFMSPHHSEGWGMNLSDTMALGRLVAATAHSGNLDFMSAETSLLIPCKVEPIGDPSKASRLFTAEMTWANITNEDLADALRTAYAMVKDGRARAIGERAKEAMKRFAPAVVGEMIRERLEAINGA